MVEKARATSSGRTSGETVTAPKGQGFFTSHNLSGKRTELEMHVENTCVLRGQIIIGI